MDKIEIEIAEQQKFFNVYNWCPMIFSWSIFISFFIAGIVVPATVQYQNMYNGAKVYGIMGFPSWICCTITWIISGGLVALGVYFFSKIRCSYKLLHILYLQKLLGDKVAKENRIDDSAEETPIREKEEEKNIDKE